jgi:hypothetical protein
MKMSAADNPLRQAPGFVRLIGEYIAIAVMGGTLFFIGASIYALVAAPQKPEVPSSPTHGVTPRQPAKVPLVPPYELPSREEEGPWVGTQAPTVGSTPPVTGSPPNRQLAPSK